MGRIHVAAKELVMVSQEWLHASGHNGDNECWPRQERLGILIACTTSVVLLLVTYIFQRHHGLGCNQIGRG